jgi:hypothetical protein
MKTPYDQGLKPRLTGEVASRHLGSARRLIRLEQGTLRAVWQRRNEKREADAASLSIHLVAANGVVADDWR